jgi:acyl carrier protein
VSSTFETVAGIISETADIPREKITPESHAIDDLGIDSLAFLDIAFAVDKAFGIKLPLEQWTQEVNEGKVPAEEYSKTSSHASMISWRRKALNLTCHSRPSRARGREPRSTRRRGSGSPSLTPPSAALAGDDRGASGSPECAWNISR